MKIRPIAVIILALTLAEPLAAAPRPLTTYFIDTEGGAATLYVSPSGASMLVDTGFGDHNGRDARRIMGAVRDARLKQIDYLVITHYHPDHVGGVPQLAALIPIRNFVDHGPNTQTDAATEALYQAYLKVRAGGNHIVARPGMEIPVPGMKVLVVTAAGEHISGSAPGGGQHNAYCPPESQIPPDNGHSENDQSLGLLITYGKFRMANLGDLTSKKEYALMCPTNQMGEVEVYMTTHHAMAVSGSAYVVDALHPIVAIADNGAHKGGDPRALEVVHKSPGIEGFWDLHYSYAAEESNPQAPFIANLKDSPDHGYWIKLQAYPSGAFTVTNQRNGESKTYQPRR
ncbi:MAG: ComEC/Rec2 family competence protein [Terriglobia bacterium]